MTEVFNSNFDLDAVSRQVSNVDQAEIKERLATLEAAFISELLELSDELERMNIQAETTPTIGSDTKLVSGGTAQTVPVSGSEELTDDFDYCDDDTCVCLPEDAPDFEVSMTFSDNMPEAPSDFEA